MPSKVLLTPRGAFPVALVRLLRLVLAFAATSFISYCGVSGLGPIDAHKPPQTAATHAERPAP